MKQIILALLVLIVTTGVYAQNNPSYNKTLADSLGADEYGMKMYVLVMLKSGSNQGLSKGKTDTLFRGHMDNIGRLVAQKKLIVAGPMGKNEKNYRGIFILDVKTVAEAATLLETDPTIKEKVLEAELYPWYGSAALPVYLPVHAVIEKTAH